MQFSPSDSFEDTLPLESKFECDDLSHLKRRRESIGFVSISMQAPLPLSVDEPEMGLGRKEGR